MNTRKVAIIIGRDPLPPLESLAKEMPVWAPNLTQYELIAKSVRESFPDALTLYKPDDSASPEEELLSLLPTIDLHHGEYSLTPWTELSVYGASPTAEIAEVLKEFGVAELVATEYGFRTSRLCQTKIVEQIKMSLEPKFATELDDAINRVSMAKAKRQRLLDGALKSIDQKQAAYLIAHEIQSEKRLEQLMVKFGDMADIWVRREDDWAKVQAFVEAELECRRILEGSEVRQLLVLYRKLRAKGENEA
jgi:hypothetical protein